MKTAIFCDIDGVLVPMANNLLEQKWAGEHPKELLPGVKDALRRWQQQGYHLVLTTGRPSCWRDFTVRQLEELGVWYDDLIMGVGSGPRYLINDLKPYDESMPMAVALNVRRNEGLAELPI